MFGTYRPEDVTILLSDITGLVEPTGTAERERRIQQGIPYSEMLPIEYEPSPPYLAAFRDALERYAGLTACAAASAAAQIWERKGPGAVLVSLARAGISAGVLIKRCLARYYGADVPHYAVSIIRGLGIDRAAMDYILARHPAESIQFVDGWTGKGAIQRQLSAAMADYPAADPGLAVLSDPARVAAVCGAPEDFLIASACLNSTVSGLLSRTFYRPDIIRPGQFHGAIFYQNLEKQDLTYFFIDAVAACLPEEPHPCAPAPAGPTGLEEAEEIARAFGIRDLNLVKPGIGEATRVLLRRVPWKLLVHSLDDSAHLGHLYQLAREKNVETVLYPLRNYRACGLIRHLADN